MSLKNFGIAKLAWIPVFVTVAIASALGQEASKTANSVGSETLREGTAVKATNARCENRGDRLIVHLPVGNVSYVAIENLATQRVLDALADDESDKYWSFSGSVTEFRSKNFLILEVVKRAMPGEKQ